MRPRGVRSSLRVIREYVNAAEREKQKQAEHPPYPSITISRTAGAGGAAIAERLCQQLQAGEDGDAPPWTPFDRTLITQVLEDQNLPQSLAQYMPEDRVPSVNALLGEILGLHPSTLTLLRKTNQVILELVEVGHAVIVGRGANLVTAGLRQVMHVRLVCSHEQAVRRIVKEQQISREEASSYLLAEDRARAAYVRQHFGVDVADPRHYHLVLNTDRYQDEEVVDLLTNIALVHFLRPLPA